ncbi:hypothetical protein [Anaerotignum sp. MB30-C6]|uniref:hypothetical protein n=1 Tax=Anaerotignum sp. MB30-C6 TaxID=3070814 RepID=UPI0027DC0A1D|nr:hypothetical protein [Anaerotignum sp. MB30-C6]WMI81628.1 hypothetical protein RBQ60_02500 [Anaerotignum sp. MB30-C6]
MTNKKNTFFTFCCSLVPGAGEMYMGLYKQGISLMLVFWGVGAIGGWAGLELLWAIIPVVWFYSFFHTHNLRSMSEEEFSSVEDKYLIYNDFDLDQADEALKRNKKVVAGALIFFGVCMVVQMGMNLVDPYFNGVLWEIAHRLNRNAVRIIVAVAAIWGGLHLLRGTKAETTEEGA